MTVKQSDAFFRDLTLTEKEAEIARQILKEINARLDFLEKVGLWQKWLELSNEEREAVNAGDIKVGFKEFAAHMAWGLPASVRDVEVRGRVVHYQTFIRCTSGPKIGDYVRSNIDCCLAVAGSTTANDMAWNIRSHWQK